MGTYSASSAMSGGSHHFLCLSLLSAAVVLGSGVQSASGIGNTTGSIQGTTPTNSYTTPAIPTPTPTPPPAPPTPGTILYQAGGSYGWNGWNGSSNWTVYDGQLLNDGGYDCGLSNNPVPSIVAPYISPINNYIVEVKIEVVHKPTAYAPGFGITIRGNAYALDVSLWAVTIFIAHTNASATFDPGQGPTKWHDYKIAADGPHFIGYVDDGKLLETDDNGALTGGQVGLFSCDYQLTISSFKVIAL